MALACLQHGSAGAQLLPTGSEFQVNSYTTSTQSYPSIAATTPGNFVVTWTSYGQDGDRWGVFVRQFSEPTTPLGTEIQVNSYTTDYQQFSKVAASPNGDFVVVWESYYQDGSYSGSFAQRFNSAGAPVGTEFQVSTSTIGEQDGAVIVADASGFMIVWEDYPDPENNGPIENIIGRRYAANGTPQGTEFQLNAPHTLLGRPGSIALTAEGFLAVYSDSEFDGDGSGVIARRFDSTGVPLSSEFLVNTYTTGFQGSERAAASANGTFVVVWSGPTGQDGSSSGIFGQRFDSIGSPLGTEFQVNTYTSGPQTRPDVTINATGEFVVIWQSSGEDGGGYGIFARSYKPDGTPETPEVQINQFISGHQVSPNIAAVDERTYVIVWQSDAQDGSFRGVYGRRFRRAGDRLSGKKLSIKASPSAPNSNALTFVSKDPSLEVPQQAFEDPRCPPSGSGTVSSGAKLRVNGAGGDFTIDLPCVNWSANDAGTRYRYRDGSGATCNAIVLRAGRLMKAICRGPQINYSLGAPQGDVFVTLTTGDPSTNRKYCATFGPQSSATVVRDGSDGRSYRAVEAGAGVCP
jgi:hypothetical protein